MNAFYFNYLDTSKRAKKWPVLARIRLLIFLVLLASCTSEEDKTTPAASGSGSGTASGGPLIARENTWTMTMTSHNEGQTYATTTLFYGVVSGTASASGGVSGFVRLKWETYVNNVLKFGGSGGWTITKKPDDTFYGEWVAFGIKLTDGAVNKVRIIAEDQIGNRVFKDLLVFADGTAPVLGIDAPVTLGATYWTQDLSIVLSGTATDNVAVREIRWLNDTTDLSGIATGTTVWTQSIDLDPGVNEIRITSEDLALNTRVTSLSIGRDNNLPQISIATPTDTGRFIATDLATLSLTGTASDGDSGLEKITWSNAATGGSGTGSGLASWSVSGIPVVQGTNTITMTAIDRVGLTQTATLDYIVDLVAPTVTIGSFSLNGGAVSAGGNPVPYTISATDAESKITHICLRYNSTVEPTANDGCWTFVAPLQNLTVNSTFLLGTAPGFYNVYAWFKDEAGRRSALTNSGTGTAGRDWESIQYNPGNPPDIRGVLVSNTDSPSDPVTEAQRTIGAGTTVYVKWRVTDVEGLAVNPMSVQFTTNETTWTEATTSLPNSSGAGCIADNAGTTADNGFTGCYKWTGASVPGGYFKVRVTAKDSHGLTASVPASPLNAGKFLTLAGNTDTGINGSARSAVVFHNLPHSLFPDGSSMAVTNAGIIYIRDLNRGILVVNPADGILRVLVKKDSTLASSNGDGGAVSSATVKYPMAIALDENENVLIYDYGRIRRINVNVTPNNIETIIGGGGNTADIVSDAEQVNITLLPVDGGTGSTLYSTIKMPLIALPNGDILFTDRDTLYGATPAGNHRIRYYDKGTGEVTTIRPSGVGTKSNAIQEISTCGIYGFAFTFDQTSSELNDLYFGCNAADIFRANPATHVSESPHPNSPGQMQYFYMIRTYQNNSIYAFGKLSGLARRLNSDGTWTNVLGTGVEGGNCPDGTLATACPVQLLDFYVAKNGKIYFMEKGMIRMFDEAGKIVTVVGQGSDYGDGGKAISARLGSTDYLGQWLNGGTVTIDFLDYQSKKIREFPIGGNITKMAGDGGGASPGNNSVATNAGLMIHSAGAFWTSLSVNYNNGELYIHPSSANIAKLNRGTGQWNFVVGGGGTNYYDVAANGMVGTSISLPGYPPSVVGFAPTTNKLLMYKHLWTGSLHYNVYYKMLDTADSFRVSHLAGSNADDPNGSHQDLWCAVDSALSGCSVPFTHNRHVLNSYDAFSGRWAIGEYATSTIRSLVPGGNLAILKTLPRLYWGYAYRHDATIDMLYYCATNGKLYQYNNSTSVETELVVNLPNYTCTGRSMTYNPTRNSIIFLYKQNGLNGIGEFGL